MGSLFLRIFLAFWVAAILLIVAVTASTRLLIDTESLAVHRERQVRIDTLAESAAEIVGSVPRERLRRWIMDWSQRLDAQLVLLDAGGNPLMASRNPPPPPRLDGPRPPGPAPQPAPAAPPPRQDERLDAPLPWPDRVFADFTGADGASYRLVANFPPVDRAAPRQRQGFHLLLALLVSGLISYLLARYLAHPLRAVRDAASALARGDLSARVGGGARERRDETGQLARDFDHMAERLEALVSDQRRLVRDVSHELRSPLARLQVALGLARQRADVTVGPELNRIEREAEGLEQIISELLLLSRLQAEQTGDMLPVDLLALCRTIAEDVAFEGTARGCEVSVDGAAATLTGDAQLLSRAIENVARNALRYSPDGGRVEIRVTTSTDGVIISICDDGPGVAEDQLQRIFEPFYRVSVSREHEGGTGGIGLAIAQRAATAHRGRILARNRDPSGLCVEIHLPR